MFSLPSILKSRASTVSTLREPLPSRSSSSESLNTMAAGEPLPSLLGTPRIMSSASSIHSNNRMNSGSSSSKEPSPLVLDMFESLDAPDPILAITLGSLRQSNTTISGVLEKLNSSHIASSPDPPQQQQQCWKPRLFVFDSSDANLYLFKAAAQPQSLPVTFLPVLDCRGFLDTLDGYPMIQIVGTGLSADGALVRRSWNLRFQDDTMFSEWLRVIKTCLLEREEEAELAGGGSRVSTQMAGTSVGMVRSRSTKTNKYSAGGNRGSVGNLKGRSASVSSLGGSGRSSGGRTKSVALQEEYAALYRQIDSVLVPEMNAATHTVSPPAVAKKDSRLSKAFKFFKF